MRYARVLLQDGRVVFVTLPYFRVLDRAPWLGGEETGAVVGAGELRRTLTPVVPSKIICIGRNYAAHARELGNDIPEEPLLFLKPTSALLDPDGTVELPAKNLSQQVEHEVELGVVIGERLSRADEASAARAIFGYTVVGDITARDLQKREKQWTRAKGMDTFCPVGPAIECGIDPSDLAIRCRVDGELRQDGSTSQMIFSPPALLVFISAAITLEPGDLVVTGTPAGVGPLVHGNRVEMEIERIGVLAFDVRSSGA
jgi:2-keto-4-pentenoate hydratase/2-oxohepta-3-ene-1,7-dioic acid hydratase in catechol pathway